MNYKWKFKKMGQHEDKIYYQAFVKRDVDKKYTYIVDLESETGKRNQLIAMTVYYMTLKYKEKRA